jgi:hypothetical protein
MPRHKPSLIKAEGKFYMINSGQIFTLLSFPSGGGSFPEVCQHVTNRA